ncbi:unnamed protein product [Prorocentrum cordatum]|uniref:Uncharacterized protein n=1 Tax=Prorocentrum cordatum TaxID=2364126 RepID=A0ABN9XG51_9DINO|nr:unnamed protein product [Polarella glacialis]
MSASELLEVADPRREPREALLNTSSISDLISASVSACPRSSLSTFSVSALTSSAICCCTLAPEASMEQEAGATEAGGGRGRGGGDSSQSVGLLSGPRPLVR